MNPPLLTRPTPVGGGTPSATARAARPRRSRTGTRWPHPVQRLRGGHVGVDGQAPAMVRRPGRRGVATVAVQTLALGQIDLLVVGPVRVGDRQVDAVGAGGVDTCPATTARRGPRDDGRPGRSARARPRGCARCRTTADRPVGRSSRTRRSGRPTIRSRRSRDGYMPSGIMDETVAVAPIPSARGPIESSMRP